jgi:hypothetical protein
VSNGHRDYEYRKATINHLAGTLPKSVAMITAGVPKETIEVAEDGAVTQVEFRASLSRTDMLRLRHYLGLEQGSTLEEAWEPVSKPIGEPTLTGDEGTLFWVEKLA